MTSFRWGWLVAMAALGAAGMSFWGLGLERGDWLSVTPWQLMARFVAEFFPPDLSAPFVVKTAWAALQTLAMSALATVLAVLGGSVLALPAAGRWGGFAGWLARSLLNVLRAVPELVWAALAVLAAGLGPFAGVLALALHTSGVLGRLFAQALENTDPAPEKALAASGSGAVAAFAYGALPMVGTQWLAYALYRWEMNIRMASVLGLVGAGGLGQMLYFHLSLFQQPQAATVLLAMGVLVWAVDWASARLRYTA